MLPLPHLAESARSKETYENEIQQFYELLQNLGTARFGCESADFGSNNRENKTTDIQIQDGIDLGTQAQAIQSRPSEADLPGMELAPTSLVPEHFQTDRKTQRQTRRQQEHAQGRPGHAQD